MPSIFSKEQFSHPLVLGAFGVIAVVAALSGVYYIVATRAPSGATISPTVGHIEEVTTGTGTVTPAQNPDLAFQTGGRVARVSVAVGDKVSRGEVLASLDLSSLIAQRAQAQASVAAAQAKLDEMQSGPRSVDVSAKQTAVDQAQTTLSNHYASVPTTAQKAYDQSFSGVSSATNNLFNSPNSSSPTFSLLISDSQLAVVLNNERTQINGDLSKWNTEVASLSGSTRQSALDAALQDSLVHLSLVRQYCNSLLVALGEASASGSASQSTISTAQTDVGNLRDTVNGLIATVQGLQQQLSSDTLAVQAAKDALNQLNASATPQDIESQLASVASAQASVANYDAQIANAEIIAPFSGTVASVQVKAGQTVPDTTTAISLLPEGALEVDVYLTEVDIAHIAVGDSAVVTLDAFGPTTQFDATVSSIDHAPTTPQGSPNATPAYKTTLQLTTSDQRITSGMSANATIIGAQKDGALIIPRSAVIQNGAQDFVLVPQGKTIVERPVELGITSTSTVEVVSGLSPTDQIIVSKQ
jgi:RND family efflux transporter MFP subunit